MEVGQEYLLEMIAERSAEIAELEGVLEVLVPITVFFICSTVTAHILMHSKGLHPTDGLYLARGIGMLMVLIFGVLCISIEYVHISDAEAEIE